MVEFHVESWIWYSVVMWIALSRFISRRLVFGSFKAFQADDYLMVAALCFFTTLIVTINIVAVSNSNLLPPGYDAASMSAEEIAGRTYGSKLILVVEQCQCAVVWGAKGCLLIMYMRFTVLARENLAIKILLGYVVLGYILMEILYLGVWCRPFNEYWAVPTDNMQCNAATNHLITNAVLNLSSDVAMLIIGLPIFIRAQIPIRKKIPVIALFSLGIFVIVSAILNKVYSFSNPFGGEWIFWYVRESSTALIVANMPFVWTLYRRIVGMRPVLKEVAGGQDDLLSDLSHPAKASRPVLVSYNSHRSTAGGTRSSCTHSVALTEERSMRSGTTAQEMLKAEYLASPGMQGIETTEVNPYTHPALYYALMAKRKKEREAMEADLALNGGLIEHTDTAPSPIEHDFGSGAPSIDRSVAASSSKRRSLGSFV